MYRLEELGIEENQKLKINNEDVSVNKVLDTCVWLQTTGTNKIRQYCIDNIAHLLMLNPTFEDKTVQAEIENIKSHDQKVKDSLYPLLANDLIGEGKPYLFMDCGIWYSGGVAKSEDGKTIKPSATQITEDVQSFLPINERFSRDSEHAYCLHYKIGSNTVKPNLDEFRLLEKSNYSCDGKHVFFGPNHVEGAQIEGGNYEIINNDKVALLRDSQHNWFVGSIKASIKNPEKCKYIVDYFLFDGDNVYIISGALVHNITKLYGLNQGETITKLSENTYQIGDRSFTYDGLMTVEWL